MNNKKTGNLLRLIAFFLTAVILICTFGFTVDGWILDSGTTASPNDKEKDNIPDNIVNEPGDTEQGNQTPQVPEIYVPEYVNYLTGLETTKELAETMPISFLMDSSCAEYGICGADIMVEIPIESGETRLLCIMCDTQNLWKIGSIAPTRGYMSNLASFFGAAIIAYGCDDQMSYESCNNDGKSLDFSANNAYHYTEFSNRVYTNVDLTNAGLTTLGINTKPTNHPSLPYSFPDFGTEPIFGNNRATKIQIGFSQTNNTGLIYNEEIDRYTLYKNGTPKKDMLNGKAPDFTNCLVLFADSVTYDNVSCSQMVMDTIGSGQGFLFTAGTSEEINWTSTSAGVLTLYNANGEKLTVNRGNTYISYMKSSQMENLIFS